MSRSVMGWMGCWLIAMGCPATLWSQDRLDLSPFFEMAQKTISGESPLKLDADQLGEIEAVEIPIQQENTLGKRLVERYERTLGAQKATIVRGGDQVERLSELVHRIHPLMTNASRYRKIRVNLVRSERFDARMFPGGHLYVFTGLLKEIENEAMLVAVLGHELSHLDHGHQLFELRRHQFLQGDQGSSSKSFRGMLKNLPAMIASFSRPFRPEEEAVADADGTRWAFELGYDPREFAKFFQKLAAKFGNGNDQAFNYFRSHPGNEKRFLETRRLADSLVQENPQRRLIIGLPQRN